MVLCLQHFRRLDADKPPRCSSRLVVFRRNASGHSQHNPVCVGLKLCLSRKLDLSDIEFTQSRLINRPSPANSC
jgi:hypothetical protein